MIYSVGNLKFEWTYVEEKSEIEQIKILTDTISRHKYNLSSFSDTLRYFP